MVRLDRDPRLDHNLNHVPKTWTGVMVTGGDALAVPRSPGMRTISGIVVTLLRCGLPMGPVYLLETRGRRTGAVRVVPVVVLRYHGNRWLVSPFGEVGWVHNIRATATARLRRGRRREAIRVVEVDDERRPLVAMHMRRISRLVPFVRAAYHATPGDGVAAFEAEAHRHPVFLIDQ
jgi:deazaflavin-dependent oxidoreductase (nitroreductase family)